MSTSRSPKKASRESVEAYRIPEPYATSLPARGARAAVRVQKALGVWPWDLVPESPPKQWAINLMEDLALVSEHVSKTEGEGLEDLRAELRRSMSRDRKPSYAGRLMAQDVQAAKKRFVQRRDGFYPELSALDDDSSPPTIRRRRVFTAAKTGVATPPYGSSAPDARPTDEEGDSAEVKDDVEDEVDATPDDAADDNYDDDEDDDPSNITVASDAAPSPAVARVNRPLKRAGSALTNSAEKRGRANSPDGSRLSAAQSLMLFSSPMASFHMGPPQLSHAQSATAPNVLGANVHDPLKPATNAFLGSIDTHVQTIHQSVLAAQRDIYPHRTVHQDAMRRYRACEAKIQGIQDDLAKTQKKLAALLEETAEQAALAPQLQALQENNVVLPPEIAKAIRSYDSRRAAKNDEVRKQEGAVDAKKEELKKLKQELESIDQETHRIEATIQDLQSSINQGTEAEHYGKLYGLVVRLGPRGMANIERVYPEIASLLDSLVGAESSST